MILYLVRHAWAGHFGDPGWPDDSLRELTPDGIERYRRVVQRLAEREVRPTWIATSPYSRCVQTAQLLSEGLPHQPPVEEVAALEPGVELSGALEWSERHTPADIAWVGHNPDMERLVPVLAGDRDLWVRFPKGSIAAIQFDRSIELGKGALLWHYSAKQLGV